MTEHAHIERHVQRNQAVKQTPFVHTFAVNQNQTSTGNLYAWHGCGAQCVRDACNMVVPLWFWCDVPSSISPVTIGFLSLQFCCF